MSDKNRPNWRLVQEKAYYSVNKNGERILKSQNQEITVGFNNTSEKGLSYISLIDTTVPITPDVNGRVHLVLFPINGSEPAPE